MTSVRLREEGNDQFKAGNFKEAEQLYTQAIQHDSHDARLLSNRAMARLKLKDWEGAELDSREAIERLGSNDARSMKSFYNLAQALVGLRRPAEALDMARIAYEWALDMNDRSTGIMSQFILQAKREIWRERETERLRQGSETLRLVEEMLEQRRDAQLEELALQYEHGEIGEVGKNEEEAAIEVEYRSRIQHTRRAFADPRKPETKERVVPDYLVDSMTFEIMHDPVITPSGTSYEKVTLLKYLNENPHDPLTRDPLSPRQLISNRALRECSEAFLRDNGWAVDY